MGYRSRYERVTARSSQVVDEGKERCTRDIGMVSIIVDNSAGCIPFRAMAMVPGNSLHPSPLPRIIPSEKFLSRRHWLCPSPLNPYFRWFQRVAPGPFVFDPLPICLELYMLSKRIFRLEIFFFSLSFFVEEKFERASEYLDIFINKLIFLYIYYGYLFSIRWTMKGCFHAIFENAINRGLSQFCRKCNVCFFLLFCCRMHVSAEVGGHLVSKWSQATDRHLQEWIVQQGQVPAQRGRQIPSCRPVSTSFRQMK